MKAAALEPVSLICTLVMLHVAAYSFIRISLPVLPDASRAFGPAMMTLAIAASLAAGVLSLTRGGWQRLAACACIGQMGVAIAGAFALTPDGITGSMVQQIATGLGTAALFLTAGVARGGGMPAAATRLAAALSIASVARVRHLRRSASHRRRRVAGQQIAGGCDHSRARCPCGSGADRVRSDAPRP